jgi:hypothetical protein
MASVTQMLCLSELTDDSVTKIRKTVEEPPRVSVYDVLQLVTGCGANCCNIVFQRLSDSYPEVATKCSNFKFSGRGQRDTPVIDAAGIIEIIMILPGKAAAKMRRSAADVMVRYLGGDPSLVHEIATNRLRQEDLGEDDPARIFGEAVESETLKRKREEVEMVELEGRLKKSRVQTASDVVRITLTTLTDMNLGISDRDKMLCKDIMTTAAFANMQPGSSNVRDICLQQFCMENGKAGKHISLGKQAKKRFLADNPGFQFEKKDIFCNGQMIQANRWTEVMRPYLEEALAQL